MPDSMSGRVVAVTGASSGIGRAAALELARLGADVVLVCRDRARGETARRQVEAVAAGGQSDLLLADLASLASVRALADELRRKHSVLHVLVNNAGVALTDRTLTLDGFETTLAVNYLAPFLLTNLLRDRLVVGAPSRVVNVSSAIMARSLDFGNLQGERRYRLTAQYATSKLALTLFTYELARRLAGTRVTANCVHPGNVNTEIFRDLRGIVKKLWPLASPFMISPERGAETTIYAATAPELESVTGAYFADCRPARSTAASYDVDLAARLWSLTEEMLGLR